MLKYSIVLKDIIAWTEASIVVATLIMTAPPPKIVTSPVLLTLAILLSLLVHVY